MIDIAMEVVVQGPQDRIVQVEAANDEIRDAANGRPCRVSMHPFPYEWQAGRYSRHAPQMQFERISDNVAVRFTSRPPSTRSRRILTAAWTRDMRESALRMASVLESSL